jgi:EAL and modified HD-GYP domain-containing signal transduction protein
MLVGDDEFRKMVTVAVAGLAASTHSEAALHLALERARFCELLAPSMNESASRLYLLGMLSVIDVILGMPMKQILNALPLDHEMKAALLGGRSSLSVALAFARCHESGDLHEHGEIQRALGITNEAASRIYLDALQWADKAARATL